MCLAVPGKILSIAESEALRSGTVNFAGITKQVNLSFVPEARVNDYVMVHVGFAISVVEESEAQRTLDYLREMGELDETSDRR